MTALLAVLALLSFTPDVSKEDIKKLVAAGVSDDVIVAFIRTHGPVAALSAEDMIDLRNAHVSDRVLAAMVQASAAPPAASPEPYGPTETDATGWFFPYGYFTDYYYGPYFWWYLGPGSPFCRQWRYRYYYPYFHYYHYPHYPYGYHWAPTLPRTNRDHTNPHPEPVRPHPTPHSTPRGGRGR